MGPAVANVRVPSHIVDLELAFAVGAELAAVRSRSVDETLPFELTGCFVVDGDEAEVGVENIAFSGQKTGVDETAAGRGRCSVGC